MLVKDVNTGEMQDIDFGGQTTQMTDANGRLIKMDLAVTDVHIDRAIANYASGFHLQGALADIAAPVVPTPNASDKYWQWDKLDAFQQVESLVASPGGAVREITPRLSNNVYVTQGYALGAFIPTELTANADAPLNPVLAHMKRIMNALTLAREIRVANLLRSPANYGTAYKVTIGSGSQWDGGASSNPVADIYARCEAALMPITDLIMSEKVWHAFVQNANVQKFTQYKNMAPGIAAANNEAASNMTALLGLPRVNISAMKYLDSTGNYSYVWGNDVVAIHRPDNNGFPVDGSDIATAYTFRFNGGNTGDSQVSEAGWQVRSFFNPARGPRGGTQIVVTHNDAEVFIQDSVSALISAAYQ